MVMRQSLLIAFVLSGCIVIATGVKLDGTVLSGGSYFDYPGAVNSDNGAWSLAFRHCNWAVNPCPTQLQTNSDYLVMVNVSTGTVAWASPFDTNYYAPCGGYHHEQSFPSNNSRAFMQFDGNFVLYNNRDPVYPAWATNTEGNSGAYLNVQNDANVVVYSSSNVPLWGTCAR
jgi:hypothetical protein